MRLSHTIPGKHREWIIMIWRSHMELSSFVDERRRADWLSRTHHPHSVHRPLRPPARQTLPRKQIPRKSLCKAPGLFQCQSTAASALQVEPLLPLFAKMPTCRLKICNVQISVMQTRATNFNSLPSFSVFGLKADTMYSANTRQFGAVFPTIMNRQAKRQATRYFGLV